MTTSLLNDRAFTLIEVMVAMGITLVALLGLLKAVEMADEQNLRTAVRDEMVQVAEERLSRFRSTPFTSTFSLISTCATCPGNLYTYAPETVPSRLRGINKSYRVTRTTVVTSDGIAVNLGVRVGWTYKNMTTSIEQHTVKTQ